MGNVDVGRVEVIVGLAGDAVVVDIGVVDGIVDDCVGNVDDGRVEVGVGLAGAVAVVDEEVVDGCVGNVDGRRVEVIVGLAGGTGVVEMGVVDGYVGIGDGEVAGTSVGVWGAIVVELVEGEIVVGREVDEDVVGEFEVCDGTVYGGNKDVGIDGLDDGNGSGVDGAG